MSETPKVNKVPHFYVILCKQGLEVRNLSPYFCLCQSTCLFLPVSLGSFCLGAAHMCQLCLGAEWWLPA